MKKIVVADHLVDRVAQVCKRHKVAVKIFSKKNPRGGRCILVYHGGRILIIRS